MTTPTKEQQAEPTGRECVLITALYHQTKGWSPNKIAELLPEIRQHVATRVAEETGAWKKVGSENMEMVVKAHADLITAREERDALKSSNDKLQSAWAEAVAEQERLKGELAQLCVQARMDAVRFVGRAALASADAGKTLGGDAHAGRGIVPIQTSADAPVIPPDPASRAADEAQFDAWIASSTKTPPLKYVWNAACAYARRPMSPHPRPAEGATPRTDAIIERRQTWQGMRELQLTDFARELERENATNLYLLATAKVYLEEHQDTATGQSRHLLCLIAAIDAARQSTT